VIPILDPALRDRAFVDSMARVLKRLKSPLGDSDLDRWEARADLNDSGFSLPAIDRLFDQARELAGRIPA
jgi:hypothetical protein